MSSFQQRYTPVPGMGPAANGQSQDMSQVGPTSPDRVSGQGYSNFNYYDRDLPAPHQFSSYSDTPSRTQSNSTIPTGPDGPSRMHSSSSSAPFAAGAAGAGIAVTPEMSQRGSYRDSLAYQNIPSEQYWPESNSAPVDYTAQAAKANRNKWLKIGAIVLGILAVIGIVVGVVVSQVTKNNNSSGSSSGSGSSNSSGDASVLPNADDPSQFDKDSNLHQSFWAIAYTPQGAMLPDCGGVQANVTRDIQLLSQLTTRLRLYGANCNSTAMVLQAIQDTKVNMTIWPAIYIDSNTQAYTDQVAAVKSAIQTYGTDHMEGIIVGNEYILNQAGSDSTTSSTYKTAVSDILTHIQDVNSTILGMSLSKHLPIGTSDAGSILSKSLATGIDFFMANVHPWFGTVPIDQAATWTTDFFQEFDVDVAETATNNPDTFIAETGWPSASANASEASNGSGSPQGDASIANMQTFLDTFVCQANANGTKYFYFEAFDEPWKLVYGGVEPYWGLFDSNRNLKNVTIPVC